MKKSQATARSDKAKEVWLESGQREQLVAASPGAFRFLARPMQLMSTETPHQSRKNSLEAFRVSLWADIQMVTFASPCLWLGSDQVKPIRVDKIDLVGEILLVNKVKSARFLRCT